MYNSTNFVYNNRYFDIIIRLSDIVLYIYDLIEIVNKPLSLLRQLFSKKYSDENNYESIDYTYVYLRR